MMKISFRFNKGLNQLYIYTGLKHLTFSVKTPITGTETYTSRDTNTRARTSLVWTSETEIQEKFSSPEGSTKHYCKGYKF